MKDGLGGHIMKKFTGWKAKTKSYLKTILMLIKEQKVQKSIS